MKQCGRFILFLLVYLLFWNGSVVYGNTVTQVPNASPALNVPALPSPATGIQSAPAPNGNKGAMTDIIDIKPLEKIGYDKKIFIYML